MLPLPIAVRTAVIDDEEDILELLRMRHDESPALCRWNDDIVRSYIRMGTEHKGGMIGVIRGGQGVEATVGLFFGREWYSEDRFLHDLWMFVHPHRRDTPHIKNLVGWSKSVAKNLGCLLRLPELGDEKNGLIRLLDRSTKRVGALFMYDGAEQQVS